MTICTQHRQCLLGKIAGGEMNLSDAGKVVYATWNEIPAHYAGVEIDRFIVMPNHVHGIINLVGAGPRACPDWDGQPHDGQARRPEGQPQGVAPTGLSLPEVVHRFKTLTTKRYVDGVKRNGWRPFPARLWQRNYYEHIIRDEDAYWGIAEYILTNPQRWQEDVYYAEANPL